MTETLVVKKRSRSQTRVQIWFRAPKIWNDFLESKAAEEYCTKSDLIKHAFRIAYGSELKEFRVKPRTPLKASSRDGSLDELVKLTQNGFSLTLAPEVIRNDPWIESMAAFVENKGSYQTRRVYHLVLNQFMFFTAKHPSEVTQSDLIRYRHQLVNMGKASSTIRQHLAAISGYYSFCISRNLTLHNPAKGVSRPNVDAYSEATWLSKNQAKALLAQPDRQTLKGKRDYAILLTLLLTGLRRNELINIRSGDLQKRGDKIYLSYICKGGTKLVRDIPERCWQAIEEYLTASRRQITNDSPLFVAVTDAGERLRHYYGKVDKKNNYPISSEAIRQLVAYYSNRALGRETKVSPHTLRHTAGTLLRKSGHSIEEVQSFLKHKRIDTTRRYLHVVESEDSDFGESIARMLDL